MFTACNQLVLKFDPFVTNPNADKINLLNVGDLVAGVTLESLEYCLQRVILLGRSLDRLKIGETLITTTRDDDEIEYTKVNNEGKFKVRILSSGVTLKHGDYIPPKYLGQ